MLAALAAASGLTFVPGAFGADPDIDTNPAVLTQTGTDGVTGSTDETQPGNQVDWAVNYQLPGTAGPGESATVVVSSDLPDNAAYVPGSLQVPDGWLPQWSNDNGASWSPTELADANQVSMFTSDFSGERIDSERIHAPLQGQVTTASGGDGWVPILIDDLNGEPRIYAIYHLAANPAEGTIRGTNVDVFCVMQGTGAQCPGGPWPKRLSSTAGALDAPGMLFDISAEDSHSYVYEGTRMYYPAIRDANDGSLSIGSGIGCFDWATIENCGYWEYGTAVSSANGGALGIDGVVRVGNRAYGVMTGNNNPITLSHNGQIMTTLHMVCLDVTTNTSCGASDLGHIPYGAWMRQNPQAVNGKVFYHAYGGGQAAAIECFDPATSARCGAPWPTTGPPIPVPASWNFGGGTWQNIVPRNSTGPSPTAIPYRTLYTLRDTNGAEVGVCQAFYAQASGTGLGAGNRAYGWHTGCVDPNDGSVVGRRTRLQQVLSGLAIGSAAGQNVGPLVDLVPSNLFTYTPLETHNFNVFVPESYTFLDTRDGDIRQIFTNSSASQVRTPNYGDRITCWNWTQAAPCVDAQGNDFPAGNGIRLYTNIPAPTGAGLQAYGFNARDNCAYGLNHHGILFSIDMVDLGGGNGSGIPCRQLARTVELDVSPDCAATAPWSQVRVTGFQPGDIASPVVTIHDGNGDIVPGYDHVPLVFNGSGDAVIDISGIPATGATQHLSADFTATYLTDAPFTTGDPMLEIVANMSTATMCFSTVTADDCILVGGQITNTATSVTVTPTITESESSVNNLDIVADADCAAAVTINKDNGKTRVSPGETSDYTITVTNQGPGPAINTVVTDTLPADLISTAPPTSTVGSCDIVASTITCDLGDLPDQQNVTITVPVQAADPLSGSTVENSAQVCHDEAGAPVCATDTDVDVVAGSITGRAWNDTDGDGIQSPGEPGVSGITVQLIGPGPDGTFGTGDDEVAATTTTGTNGEYHFDGLDDGDYQVRFDAPPGSPISPKDQGGDDTIDSDADPLNGTTDPVTVTAGSRVENLDLGIQASTTDISGDVWRDDDGDGIQTPGEPGVPNVTVELIGPGPDGIFGTGDDELVATTTTDANGTYLFGDVTPGDYRIRVIPPGDSAFTSQDQGGDDTTDSDVDPDGNSGTFNGPDGPDAGLVPNFTPTPDHRITPQGVPVTFNIIDNDNIDGRAPGSNLPSAFTYTRHDSPTWGSITCNPGNGSCTWTPADHYVGDDGFGYVLHSQTWGDYPLQVTLESLYVNDPPIIRADRVRTNPDTAVSFNVLSNDEDPNDPTSSWEPSGPNQPGDALTAGSFGTVLPVGAGSVSCDGTGDCEFTPAAGYQGTAAFTYTGTDTGLSDPRVDDPDVPGGINAVDALSGIGTVTIWVDPDPISHYGFTGEDTDSPVNGTRHYPETGDIPTVTAECVAGAAQATVAVGDSPEATRYRIERSTPGDPAGWVLVGHRTNPGDFIDHHIAEGVDYQYRVRPELHRWNGTPSNASTVAVVPKPSGNPLGCNP